MTIKDRSHLRLERTRAPSVASWQPRQRNDEVCQTNAVVDCGWGRLLFGETFHDAQILASALQEERTGKRDVALYLQTSRNRAKTDRFFGHILLDCGHFSVICGGQSIHYRSSVLD
jgi:hypothetical protein